MIRAAAHGLSVTKPWSGMSHYDFVVEYKAHFARVQVKSTMFKKGRSYCCSVRGSRGPYVGDPFDFVAAYLIPADVWYIIPVEKFKGQEIIRLIPGNKNSKYTRNEEAWHLLRGKPAFGAGTVANIEACAAEFGVALGDPRLAMGTWPQR
jgi:hypothetical protein